MADTPGGVLLKSNTDLTYPKLLLQYFKIEFPLTAGRPLQLSYLSLLSQQHVHKLTYLKLNIPAITIAHPSTSLIPVYATVFAGRIYDMVITAIPPGKTWFDTHKTSFSDVTIGPDGGIDTESFLEAAEATTTLFGISPPMPGTHRD